MLENEKFKVLFDRIKEILPNVELRQEMYKILQDCNILTQRELQQYLTQIEAMRQHIKILENRIEALEAKKTKKPLSK